MAIVIEITDEMVDRVVRRYSDSGCPICDYTAIWGTFASDDDRRRWVRTLLELAVNGVEPNVDDQGHN